MVCKKGSKSKDGSDSWGALQAAEDEELWEELEGECEESSLKSSVSLPVKSFLSLLKKARNRSTYVEPPKVFLVRSVSLTGTTLIGRPLEVAFKLTVRVEALSDVWGTIALLPTTSSVKSASVIRISTPSSYAIVLSAEDTAAEALKLSASSASTTNNKAVLSDGSTAGGSVSAGHTSSSLLVSKEPVIGVVNGFTSLIANSAGLYEVVLSIITPLAVERRLTLRVPAASASLQTELEFEVQEEDVAITVSPSNFLTQSTSTVADRVDDAAIVVATATGATAVDKESLTSEVVRCLLPPTAEIVIQWQKVIAEEEVVTLPKEKPEEKKTAVTVEQHTLHSIGEGIIQCTSVFHIQIQHGTRSLLEVRVPLRQRVLQVIGGFVKTWEIVDTSMEDDMVVDVTNTIDVISDARDGTEHPGRTLGVRLTYGVEGKYTLTIKSEHDMGWTSGHVTVPAFHMLNVDREKGQLAIEARTSVEIAERSFTSLAKIDINEAAPVLRQHSDNPMLLAYKFLSARGTLLELDVTKHSDVGVLIAVIDDGWFEATCSESGQVLIKITLSVRNTQKQYVRLAIPDRQNVEIWSSTVGDVAVKPAEDGNGVLLVPLEKSSGRDGRADSAFVVEVVYMGPFENMTKQGCGKLAVAFPEVDMPISRLYSRVYVPAGYTYGEFSGDLNEVSVLGKSPPSSSDHNNRSAQQFIPSNMMVQQQAMSNIDFEVEQMAYDMDESICCEDSSPASFQFGKKGVLPVKVSDLRVGESFVFERLLVQSEELRLCCPYKKKYKSFFQRRYTSSPWLVSSKIAAGVAILAIAVCVGFSRFS